MSTVGIISLYIFAIHMLHFFYSSLTKMLLIGTLLVLSLSLGSVITMAQEEDTFGSTDEFVQEDSGTGISEGDAPSAPRPDSDSAIDNGNDIQQGEKDSSQSQESSSSKQESSSVSNTSQSTSEQKSTTKDTTRQKGQSITAQDVETDDTVRSGGAEVILGITIAGIIGGALYLYFRFVKKDAMSVEGDKTHKK
jgi:hypothetical protein